MVQGGEGPQGRDGGPWRRGGTGGAAWALLVGRVAIAPGGACCLRAEVMSSPGPKTRLPHACWTFDVPEVLSHHASAPCAGVLWAHHVPPREVGERELTPMCCWLGRESSAPAPASICARVKAPVLASREGTTQFRAGRPGELGGDARAPGHRRGHHSGGAGGGYSSVGRTRGRRAKALRTGPGLDLQGAGPREG